MIVGRANAHLLHKVQPTSRLTGGAIPDTSQILQETTVAELSRGYCESKIVRRGDRKSATKWGEKRAASTGR